MQNLSFCGVLFLILAACSSDENKLHFSKTGEIDLDVGFVANQRYAGIWSDKYSATEYLFLGDPVTFKCIKLFSLDGVLQQFIPLEFAMEELNKIENFHIHSLDTIIVFGQFNNRLAFIDRTGKVWKKVDINRLIQDTLDYPVQYSTSYNRDFLLGEKLFLKTGYAPHRSNIRHETITDFFRIALDVPYFLRIDDIFADSTSGQFGLNSFYRRIMTDTTAMGELMIYSFAGQNLVVQSRYSDSIYIVNPVELIVERIIPVKSSYTKLGFYPVPVIKSKNDHEKYNRIAENSGGIFKVMFDVEREVYIVSVFFENDSKDKREKWNYSYILLDKDGNKINEVLWDPDIYNAACAFYNNGLLYISSNSEFREGYSRKRDRYEIFQLVD